MFILKTLRICIYIYQILLILRILCTWFWSSSDGKLWHYLCLFTGPYLALFKGLKSLRQGIFDFTPMVAIGLLIFINSMLGYTISMLARYSFSALIPLGAFLSSWCLIIRISQSDDANVIGKEVLTMGILS